MSGNEEQSTAGTRIDLPEEFESGGIAHIRVGSLVQNPSPETVMDLIRQSPLFDATEFEGETPYDWTARVSNTEVDAYYTHMMESTLKNYAADATASVPFQHSHDPHSMPIGRSLAGEYSGGKDPATTVLFYTFPGLRSKDISSDEFMRGVRAGVYRDVSVGFFGGNYICDICQRDLMTYECGHFPGMKYPMPEDSSSSSKKKKKGPEMMVMATAGIDDAHLAEVSTVYRGATPGAVILKARGMALAGELRPEVATMLEGRYRIVLPRNLTFRGIEIVSTDRELPTNVVESDKEPEVQVAEINQIEERVLDTQTEPEVNMPEKNEETTTPEIQIQERVVEKIVEREVPAKPVRAFELVPEEVRAEIAAYGVAEDMDAARAVSALLTHIRAMTPQAEDGKAYREHLIDEGIKAVVRAYGDEAEVDRYRTILGQQSVDTIRTMTKDWEKLSSNEFKAGRQTVDGEETVKTPKSTSEAPNRLYAV